MNLREKYLAVVCVIAMSVMAVYAIWYLFLEAAYRFGLTDSSSNTDAVLIGYFISIILIFLLGHLLNMCYKIIQELYKTSNESKLLNFENRIGVIEKQIKINKISANEKRIRNLENRDIYVRITSLKNRVYYLECHNVDTKIFSLEWRIDDLEKYSIFLGSIELTRKINNLEKRIINLEKTPVKKTAI